MTRNAFVARERRMNPYPIARLYFGYGLPDRNDFAGRGCMDRRAEPVTAIGDKLSLATEVAACFVGCAHTETTRESIEKSR